MKGPEMTEIKPDGDVILRVAPMPADENMSGDIFGGWVLSQMDVAGGFLAAERAKGRVATVAIEAMKFIRPVKVGDMMCIYGDIHRVGRTSIAVSLESWVMRGQGAETAKVTEGIFTFVALDDNGDPRPVDNT